MRLLLAGAWRHMFYEEACADALRGLGIEVIPFSWDSYLEDPLGRVESKYVLRGPRTRMLNRGLIEAAGQVRPDVTLVWRGTSVLRETVEALQAVSGRVVAYNNDDPFSPLYARSNELHLKRLWRMFIPAIPAYDLHLVYRKGNIEDFISAGARRAELLRSYFIPSLHRPLKPTPQDRARYGSDVIFVGHWDPVREAYVRALVEAGIKVRVFGSRDSWTARRIGDLERSVGPVKHLTQDEYARALSASQIALSVYSRLNRDSYTRRVFEITACQRLLLSERTDEMLTLFPEGEAAAYFSSADELVATARRFLADDAARDRIARAGRTRVVEDGHSVDARMKELLQILETLG